MHGMYAYICLYGQSGNVQCSRCTSSGVAALPHYLLVCYLMLPCAS